MRIRSGTAAYSHLVSQLQSKLTITNENSSALANSVISYDQLKESVSTRQPSSGNRSSTSLYSAKMESKVLELQKKIDTQKYQIQLLNAQTQQLVGICQKQKQKLSNLNIQTLRGEYEQHMSELVEEKQKITEVIYVLKEQYRQQQEEQDAQLYNMKKSNDLLTKQIEKALDEKSRLLSALAEIEVVQRGNEDLLIQQEQRVDQLRNIERKLMIAMKQRKILESKK